MAHTTHTTTQYAQPSHRPTHIATSQGILLPAGTYTHTDLATWTAWAYRVASHPAVLRMGMQEDAEARICRLEAGEVWDTDISGLQDWADAEGWL